ncbi:MAG: DUF3857 domain-containing protein, partial [Calothrix sp. SM1_5_4]|nr:DUF3857 domain-containing protein [Calothrix sp. SM1_5_4]
SRKTLRSSASLFSIDYNAMTDKVEVLEAYTQNGRVKIPVDPSAIEDRDKGEAKDYDAMKSRSVVFPQVQIGSRLFVRYRVTTAKPLVQDRWSDRFTLAPGLWVDDFRWEVKAERPLYHDVQDPRGLIAVEQKGSRHIVFKNKKPLPGWVSAEKDPYFHPAGATEIHVSTHMDWREFLEGLGKGFEKVQAPGVPDKLKPWLQAARKKKSVDERILHIMERMSHDFRYFGDWRRHDGGLVPRSLAEIENPAMATARTCLRCWWRSCAR